MLFSVRRYRGADNPLDGYEEVEAGSAKEAAEQLCGELLTENGSPMRLRALVHTKPPERLPVTFYAIAD